MKSSAKGYKNSKKGYATLGKKVLSRAERLQLRNARKDGFNEDEQTSTTSDSNLQDVSASGEGMELDVHLNEEMQKGVMYCSGK